MKRLLCVVIVTVCSSVWASSQTLADLARQERAKKQATSKTPPITSEVLRPEPIAPAAGTPEGATPAGTAADGTTPEKGADGTAQTPATAPATTPARDEKSWRGEYDKARGDVQRLESQITVLESDLRTANRDYLTRAYDPDGRGRAAIAETGSKLDAARKDLEAARARVTQVEEDFRRSGAPAGWLR